MEATLSVKREILIKSIDCVNNRILLALVLGVLLVAAQTMAQQPALPGAYTTLPSETPENFNLKTIASSTLGAM